MSHRSLPPSHRNPPSLLPATVVGFMNARREPMERPEWAEPRGVYWAHHTQRGRRVLYSVDSRGEEVKRITVPRGADPDDAIRYLHRHLDLVDPPPPPLRLVRTA